MRLGAGAEGAAGGAAGGCLLSWKNCFRHLQELECKRMKSQGLSLHKRSLSPPWSKPAFIEYNLLWVVCVYSLSLSLSLSGAAGTAGAAPAPLFSFKNPAGPPDVAAFCKRSSVSVKVEICAISKRFTFFFEKLKEL